MGSALDMGQRDMQWEGEMKGGWGGGGEGGVVEEV